MCGGVNERRFVNGGGAGEGEWQGVHTCGEFS